MRPPLSADSFFAPLQAAAEGDALREAGTLKLSVHSWDFIPHGKGQPIHRDVVMELDEYAEDRTEKDLEKHVAPAIRRHMLDFLAARDTRSKPVADIIEGHISRASCLLANVSQQLGRSLEWDAEKEQVVGDEEETGCSDRHIGRRGSIPSRSGRGRRQLRADACRGTEN